MLACLVLCRNLNRLDNIHMFRRALIDLAARQVHKPNVQSFEDFKEEELPENWGLLVWDGKKIHKIKQAVRVDTYAHGELLMITSIMLRILRP